MADAQTDTLVFSSELSGVIHELHAGAMLVPASEFQHWALRQLQALLPANRWYWGVGCEATDLVHAGFAIDDPVARQVARSLGGQALGAVLSSAALAVPGRARFAMDEHVPAAAASEAAGTGVWEAGIRCNGVGARAASRLEVCVREPLSGLQAFLVCTRHGRRLPFSLAERALLGALAPHLFTAWRHARLAALHAQVARSRARSAAVVDRQGVLHVAESRFFGLLRSAWPVWSGTRLPPPLLALLGEHDSRCGTEQHLVEGLRWSVTQVAGEDAIVITATPAGALQRLTPGEARVAAKILEGRSYEEAAESLCISVNTLRNTLVRAYRRLGVRNKVELLRRLEGA